MSVVVYNNVGDDSIPGIFSILESVKVVCRNGTTADTPRFIHSQGTYSRNSMNGNSVHKQFITYS